MTVTVTALVPTCRDTCVSLLAPFTVTLDVTANGVARTVTVVTSLATLARYRSVLPTCAATLAAAPDTGTTSSADRLVLVVSCAVAGAEVNANDSRANDSRAARARAADLIRGMVKVVGVNR